MAFGMVMYSGSDVNRLHWKELRACSTTAVSLSVFQVDPLFTVPAPPPPISSSLTPQILPSYFSPSSSNIAAPVEQLLVRTRSVGVNTCEVGVVTEPECLGPCEPGTSVNLEGIVWHETEEGKYHLFLSFSPQCPLPDDVSVSTCTGDLVCGIQRGKKSSFSALLIFVEIRATFSPFCSRLLLHSGSIRCLSKRFSASSANLEGLWEAGWGLPIPLRGVMEKRTGDRDQGHFLLGFLAHLSWCGCFCVVEAYMYLLNWARVLASSKGHRRDVAVADAKGKGLSPRWATLFSSVAREGALSPPLNSAGLLASATR